MSFDTAKLYIQSYRPETTLCTLLRSINQAMLTAAPFYGKRFHSGTRVRSQYPDVSWHFRARMQENTFGDDGLVAHQKASETKSVILRFTPRMVRYKRTLTCFLLSSITTHMKIIRTVVTKGLIEHGWKMRKNLCS